LWAFLVTAMKLPFSQRGKNSWLWKWLLAWQEGICAMVLSR
jgi:hypothetical protein